MMRELLHAFLEMRGPTLWVWVAFTWVMIAIASYRHDRLTLALNLALLALVGGYRWSKMRLIARVNRWRAEQSRFRRL